MSKISFNDETGEFEKEGKGNMKDEKDNYRGLCVTLIVNSDSLTELSKEFLIEDLPKYMSSSDWYGLKGILSSPSIKDHYKMTKTYIKSLVEFEK